MKFMIKNLIFALVVLTFDAVRAQLCAGDHDVLSHNTEFNISVTCAPGTPDTYLGFDFANNAGPFADLYAGGWCIDVDRNIYCDEDFSVDSYSSYDNPAIPPTAVDKPENLDLVNWLINTHPTESYVNISGCYEGLLGFEEYQEAVWTLLDNQNVTDLGAQDCVVDWLIQQAETYGDGYELSCEDPDAKIGVILIIDDDSGFITHQVIMAEIPLAEIDGICECDNPGAGGDPHFKTWAGQHYDFHGLCDLVLLENHGFDKDLGMDIHIRTKQKGSWSYISNAVLRIGDDTLEVMGGTDESHYWINGIIGEKVVDSDVVLPVGLSGYPITFKLGLKKQNEYHIDLGKSEMIVIKTWNDLVRVDILGATKENFGNSRGLMGKYRSGKRVARDGSTELKDLNAFGQEWQVLRNEAKLFHNLEGPQSPQACVSPSPMEMRRRLGETRISQQEAEAACSRVNKSDQDLCIFDVMATNDADVAGAY